MTILYAIIENKVITNLAIAEPEFAASQGWFKAPAGVGIGDFYENGEFVKRSSIPPTPEELQAQADAHAALIEAQRAEAYRTESDPLFFKSQRGEATHEEWLAKVAEIKARYA